MSPPERSGAPPAERTRRQQDQAVTRPTSTPSVTDESDIVPAIAYRPDDNRRRWLVILEVCPACGLPHHFYGTPGRPPRRRSCRGKAFTLFAVYGGQSEPPEVA